MKRLASALVMGFMNAPPPAHALLLDCEIDARRVYTCVEVGPPGAAGPTTDVMAPRDDAYSRYIEEAKQQCVYEEPRRRTAGKNTGMAARMEELKTAQEEYEACISDTARELWLRDNPPGE